MPGFCPTPIDMLREKMIEDSTQFTCDLCGSVVFGLHRKKHDEWHEKLRIAVDETGQIGY